MKPMVKKAFIPTLAATALTLGMSSAFAKPPLSDDPQNDPDCRGKQLYKFNAIQVNNKDTANCDNNGSRMFFSQNNNSRINWYYEDSPATDFDVNGFEIADCDGTVDGTAAVYYDDSGKVPEGSEVLITAVLHGPTDMSFNNFACDRVYIGEAEGETADDCVIGTGTIGRKFHTTVNKHLFDTTLQYIAWTWQGDWKVMDIRVYEDVCANGNG